MKLKGADTETLKNLAIGSAVGIGSIAGLFFLGRHVIRSLRTNAAQNDSMDEGDPATYAKQLKMAFDNDNSFGWGTNEDAIFSVFRELPSKSMYSKVQREYTKLYNRNLNADLEDELSSDEYNELIIILNGKK